MTKTVNYTKTETQKTIELYQELGNDGLEEIAKQLNKTINSIRAKLVKEKVYEAPERPSKQRKNGPTKKELLRELSMLGLSNEGLDGLQSATKIGLNEVMKLLKQNNE